MVSIGQFIAGPYSATYNAKALGQSLQGWSVSIEVFKRIVTADKGGDTPQDAIIRGRAQYLDFELAEAESAAIPDLLAPYTSSVGTQHHMGIIGLLDVGYSGFTGRGKQVVFTAIAGSSAALSGPATATFPVTALAEGYPVRILMGPDLRTVPARLRVYPDADGVFGTET